jgi:hypothetical protein
MRRSRSSVTTLLAAVLLLSAASPASASDPIAGSAALVEGSCAAPGAAVASLAVAAPGSSLGAVTAVPVTTYSGIAPLGLTTLVAAPHALVVRGGPAETDPVVACGDVGGSLTDGTDLAFGVAALGASGVAGIAHLMDEADGTTTAVVTVTQPAAPVEPTAETVSLAGDLYFAGWSIEITSATYDPFAATLAIEGTYENHGDLESSLLVIQQDGGVRLLWNGTVVEVHFTDGLHVPAQGKVPATLVAVYAVPEGFSLADSVLTFGQPTDQQATLPLTDGATGTSFLPQPFEASGKAAMKGYATVRIDGGQVVAAACGGRADEVYFTTADADQLSILLDVTILGNKIGGQFESYVTAPDGITGPGTPGSGTPSARETIKGRLCYTVPAPVQGHYVLAFEGNEKRAKVTITIP